MLVKDAILKCEVENFLVLGVCDNMVVDRLCDDLCKISYAFYQVVT
jgi:hypothetical protein